MPEEIDVPIRDPERFRGLLPPERFEEFDRGVEEARVLLDGRAVWNVNNPQWDVGAQRHPRGLSEGTSGVHQHVHSRPRAGTPHSPKCSILQEKRARERTPLPVVSVV